MMTSFSLAANPFSHHCDAVHRLGAMVVQVARKIMRFDGDFILEAQHV
ncbi:Unknown protein sequence [Pseudomonas syringae pv. maculicola str. M6]|nr:Unknown protein sequence [Pseudomonas syringae pv. maculicola str. M6]